MSTTLFFHDRTPITGGAKILEEIPEEFLYLFDDPNIPDVEFNTLRDII